MAAKKGQDIRRDSDSGPNGTARFEPINQLRAHEYVADQIRRHIALGLVQAGEALPSERELVALFGVGRPTVQHALRLLEADRLVVARRGRHGGTFVLDSQRDEGPGLERLVQMVNDREEIEALLVYRRCLEPQVASLAATTRRAQDIRTMRRASGAMRNAPGEADYMRNDTQLHLAIAAATRNQFIERQIEEIRLRLNNVISLLPESDHWHSRINDEHDTIIGCIEDGDTGGALEAMGSHIARSDQAVRAALRALAENSRRIRPRPLTR